MNTLHSKLSKLVLLIIDEHGWCKHVAIHNWLQQVKAVLPDVMFGGLSVPAVGDL